MPFVALVLGVALYLSTDLRPASAQTATPTPPPQSQVELIDHNIKKFQKEAGLVDEGNEIGKAAGALADGNCQIGVALAAIAKGKDADFAGAMKSASSSYDIAVQSLESLTKDKRYKKKISSQHASWLIDTGLFTDPPRTQNDILLQILSLTQKAKEAADRIASGNGTDVDLSLLLDISSKIPRLLMVFIKVVAAA
ncbi:MULTISPECIES: hypothetical protein [unclassified Ensifer]|nr:MULTISPECIES: hypothetical protein [unclassified Ensifer]